MNRSRDREAAYDAFLRNMRTYSFYGCDYSAASLRDLKIMTQLVELDASQSLFDDAGIHVVSTMRALESLNVADTNVTNRGLSTLVASGAPQGARESLRWLNVSRTRITQMAGISALANLNTLFARGLSIERGGISELGQLVALKRLDLSESPICTGDLHTLVGHACLEQLDIARTEVGDDVYDIVMEIPQLRWVTLVGSAVSQGMCHRIYRDHPRLRQSAGLEVPRQEIETNGQAE